MYSIVTNSSTPANFHSLHFPYFISLFPRYLSYSHLSSLPLACSSQDQKTSPKNVQMLQTVDPERPEASYFLVMKPLTRLLRYSKEHSTWHARASTSVSFCPPSGRHFSGHFCISYSRDFLSNGLAVRDEKRESLVERPNSEICSFYPDQPLPDQERN